MSRFYNREFTAKIISILFALVMWIYVMGVVNPRVTKTEANIPVLFVNTDEIARQGLVVTGDTDNQIRVKLTGRRDEVFKIKRDQIKAVADLRGLAAGLNSVPVEVTVPGNIEIDYSPRFIKVELEEIVRKQKEVNIEIAGRPRNNYVIGTPKFEPAAVWVEGPESQVNAVHRVIAKFELSDEFENISARLPLIPLNSRGEEVKNVTVKTSYVDVLLPIDRLKSLEVQPIIEGTAAEGYFISNISVEPENITVRGREDVLVNIEKLNTKPIIINNLTDNINQTVAVEVPEDVTVFGGESVNVVITVKKAVDRSIVISKDEIKFLNLKEDLKIDTSSIPQTLELKVTAAESIAQSIQPKDFQIIVNVEGLAEKEYTLEPRVEYAHNLKNMIKQAELKPRSINFKIISVP